MPPLYRVSHRDQFTNILNAASGNRLTASDIGAIVGSIVGAVLLVGVVYIWNKRRCERKERQRTIRNGGLDAVTLQRQNRERLRALQSMLAPPAPERTDGDWRSKAHPIWQQYRRGFEAELRAEGYSETAIQLASESGIDDTIFPDDSATQVAERARVPPGRLQEYITQQIQDEITRQRGLGLLSPTSELTAGGSRTESTIREPARPVQQAPKPASRFRLPRWIALGTGKQEDADSQPSRQERSQQSIELSRLPPTASDRSRETRIQQSTSTERARRPEEYTANDRIRYMVRVASEQLPNQRSDGHSERRSEPDDESNFRIYH
jgi:hypothetical protein